MRMRVTMTLAPFERLLGALDQRQRRRSLQPIAGLDFASNDYLGLAGSDLVRDLALAALRRGVPPGAGAARLLRGNHDAFARLEDTAAAHFGSAAALYFGSGFAANLGLFAGLPAQRDLVLHDALIHASSRDGMRLGAAESRSFAHNDVQAARAEIRAWRKTGGTGQVWLAVESLYSMDGDRAPLADFHDLAQECDGFLVVDEAHATGVWGPQGRGFSAGIAGNERVVTLHTCGKALGVQGALICAAAPVIQTLINRARSFVYSTAPSPLLAEVLRGVLMAGDELATRRAALRDRIDRLPGLLRRLDLAPSGSQIQPIPVAGDAACLALAGRVQARGFDLRPIRSPTVPKGAERLRLSLTLNTPAEALDALIAALDPLLQEVRRCPPSS